MKPRILVGTAEIAKYVHNATAGFRELGYEVDSVVLPESRNKYYPGASYSITELEFLKQTTYFEKPGGRVGIRTTREFADFAKRYDIFVLFASTSLLPRMVDLPVLKAMGKTIIVRQCGSEIRDTQLAAQFWDAHGAEYPAYQHHSPGGQGHGAQTEYEIFGLPRYHPALANKLHNMRMAERYADAIISAPPSQTLGLRPYFQSGPIYDAREFTFRVPRRAVPVILHAPSNMEFKGTDAIVNTLDELSREGVAFRLNVLNGVGHDEVRKALADADILVDQLSCGAGTLAYEGMASGCAVLGGHMEAASPLPRNRPIHHVTRDTLKERLREVIRNVELRTSLAVQGREFVNSGYGSPAGAAQYMLDAVERDRRGDADLYPTLFAERGLAAADESVPAYLKGMTLDVLLRHGAHPDTDLARLIGAGFLSADAASRLTDVPRWDTKNLRREGPWVLTGPGATYGQAKPNASPPSRG